MAFILIFKLLSAFLVALLSTQPILILSANNSIKDLYLSALQSQPRNLKVVESYLEAAIEQNDSDTAKFIINHVNEMALFGRLIEEILSMDLIAWPAKSPNQQTIKLNESRITNLMSKEIISAVDLGYLMGLEELLRLLIEWKLKKPNGSLKSMREVQLDILNVLLNDSLDVNAKNDHGDTLLHVVCRLNKLELVRFLLGRNAKYATNIFINLHLRHEKYYGRISSHSILDINSQNNVGDTVLHYACRLESPNIVALLLAVPKINVNLRNQKGYTAMLEASSQGRLEIVKALLSNQKLNLNIGNNDGDTALHITCKRKELKILSLLLADPRVNVNIKNKTKCTSIMDALAVGCLSTVKTLLGVQELNANVENNSGNTPLHIACREGQLEMVRLLIADSRVNLNYQNKRGLTAVMEASLMEEGEIVKALLYRKDLDLTAKDNHGNTLLHIVCRKGQLEIMQCLLDRNMDFVIILQKMVVAMLFEQSMALYTSLSQAIIDINARNNSGATPLHCACRAGNLNAVLSLLEMPEISVNIQDEYGNTAVMLAVSKAHLKVAKALLSRTELNVAIMNNNQDTLLHIACRVNQLEIVEHLIAHNLKVKTAMLTAMFSNISLKTTVHTEQNFYKHLLKLNAPNGNGITPLRYACQLRNVEIVELLLGMSKLDMGVWSNEREHSCAGSHDGSKQHHINQQLMEQNLDQSTHNSTRQTSKTEGKDCKSRGGLVSRFFRSMDAFPKVDTTYLDRTSHGAIASIITYVLMGILMIAEVVDWVNPELKFEFSVDRTIYSSMPLSFDISVATECSKLAIIVHDDGDHAEFINQQVTMTDFNFMDVLKTSMNSQIPKQFLNTAENKVNGCRLRGTVQVNKVNGKLVIVPIVTALLGQFSNLKINDKTINFSHVIHYFSFGNDYGVIENPLNHHSNLSMQPHENFSYFLSVLSTKYHTITGHQYDTNQYAVTGYLGLYDEMKIDRPGLYFKFELEPLSVAVIRGRAPCLSFFIHMVGILGGIYTFSGLINILVSAMIRAWNKSFGSRSNTFNPEKINFQPTSSKEELVTEESNLV